MVWDAKHPGGQRTVAPGQGEPIIAIFPAVSHTVFPEFQAYCGAFSHASYKDSPLRPLRAEIGSERIKAMTQSYFRRKILALVGAVVVLAVWGAVSSAQADWIRHSTSGDMFYNYYVPSAGEQSVGAQLYLSPRPTPPLVGHTYITYQPLMPHEYLYKHHRVYWTKHNDAPPTRTSVRWR
jgi:hypothetical protein